MSSLTLQITNRRSALQFLRFALWSYVVSAMGTSSLPTRPLSRCSLRTQFDEQGRPCSLSVLILLLRYLIKRTMGMSLLNGEQIFSVSQCIYSLGFLVGISRLFGSWRYSKCCHEYFVFTYSIIVYFSCICYCIFPLLCGAVSDIVRLDIFSHAYVK